MTTNVRSNPPNLDALAKDTHREFARLNRALAQLTAIVNSSTGGTPALALDDLTDVDTSGESAGEVLTFDGATWVPTAAASGDITAVVAGDGLTGGGASGSVTLDVAAANSTITVAANSIAVGTLAAGNFPTAPGIVTPAMLDNGAALSVLGVTGAAGAARADIASGAGRRYLGSNAGNTAVTFREIAIYDVSQVLYEVDFSGLATNAFANGTEVIDGLSWTVGNSAAAGATWGIVNGTGLRFSAATSTVTVFTSTTQSAAHLYLPLSSLPNWVQGLNLVVELNFVADTFENGNDNCRFGLWGPAASPESGSAGRVSGGIKGNNGGTVTIGVGNGTTSTFSADAHDSSAVSARIESNGFVQSGYGTYSGGWPSPWTYAVCNNTASATGSNSLMDGTVRLFIAFPTASDASPTTAVDIARMRIRTS